MIAELLCITNFWWMLIRWVQFRTELVNCCRFVDGCGCCKEAESSQQHAGHKETPQTQVLRCLPLWVVSRCWQFSVNILWRCFKFMLLLPCWSCACFFTTGRTIWQDLCISRLYSKGCQPFKGSLKPTQSSWLPIAFTC